MFGIDPKRIRGLIQGCALGDAFGMPTEMLSQEFIRENIGDITELKASFDFSVISKNRPAGSITDDTMNTLMMMEMIKESNGVVNVNLYLDKLMEWSVNSPIAEFVTGPSTHRALEAIKSGVSLEETGKMGTTNGAAMKIAPLGIVCDYQDLPTLVETVADICKPTHNTSIAIQGASVIAAIASYILREGSDWEEIWQIASKTANLASKYGNQLPTASIEHRMKLAKEIVDTSPVEVAMQRLYLEVGTGLETIELVPSALAIAYLS
ncbi:MAG: ADP-ribosylglycohydrolase, partial [Erysipelothrix sp.]|nr:ADP-ribosylglycohydrolase [Erysipelothrix sp.]